MFAFAKDSPSRTHIENAPAWTAQAPRVGAIPAAQKQQLTAVLGLRDAAAAEALATAVSDPSSAQYGHYVTAAAWRSRFAPTEADVAQVTSWLRSQGFSIGAIPLNHRFISFSGTSAEAEKAFATDLQVFKKDGQVVQDSRHGVIIRECSGRVLTSQERCRGSGFGRRSGPHTVLSSGYGPSVGN